MPRSTAVAVENTFAKGLITEATGLNFPENACTETFNCVFSHTGEVSRRLGLDYESQAALNADVNTEDNAVREFLWKAVAQNGEITFVVVQVGNELIFYQVAFASLSGGLKSFTVNLEDFRVSGSPTISDITCSFDSGNGYLFVSHPYCEPFYVSYDVGADEITAIVIDVKVRDFEGLDDGLEDDQRPTTLTKEHHYNLLNQGWYVNTALTVNLQNWVVGSPLQYWKTSPLYPRADFPSNSDIWWTYKSIMRPTLDTNGNVTFPAPLEAFSMIEANNIDKMGNTSAPKGHYIFTAWNMDRASVSYSAGDTQTSLSGIPAVTSGYQRPSQVAFYASRVWYAGTNANQFNTKIYFSKIIEKTGDFGKCYQNNDPTSEKTGDLLPSDGGIVVIPSIATIVKMQVVGTSLFIFATNGVWKIEGSQGIGFAANDYSITKLSPIGALSDTSFVDVEGMPMWWNNEGIWGIQSDPTGTSSQVTSLSFASIQSFIDDISNTNKRYVKGAYNPLTKTVQWLYNTIDIDTVEDRYAYNKILNLSMVNQCYYPWSIDLSSKHINGLVVIQGVSSVSALESVVDNNGNEVTTGAGVVTINSTNTSDVTTIFKYLISDDNTDLSFAEFADDNYLDWNTFDYSSYFITGYKVHGDGIKKFQPNYTQIYIRNEVASVFDFQSRFDYANIGNTGRWSNLQRVYFNNLNYSFRMKRLKNRGHGKALQYMINSVEGEPFNIIGWSTAESANAQP